MHTKSLVVVDIELVAKGYFSERFAWNNHRLHFRDNGRMHKLIKFYGRNHVVIFYPVCIHKFRACYVSSGG